MIYSLTASPGYIQPGQTSILSWSVINASTVTISPTVGPVSATGSVVVMPGDTTTYVLYAYNIRASAIVGDTATAGATVYVAPYAGTYGQTYGAPVVSSFTANPNYIQPGQATTLSWNVNSADTITISPSVGAVAGAGSFDVAPDSTTTYTLSASNSGGAVNAGTTVTVATVVTSYVPPASAIDYGARAGTALSGTVPGATVNTSGVGGAGTTAVNLWPMYLLLLGLVAAGSTVLVALLVRKPAVPLLQGTGAGIGYTASAFTVAFTQPVTSTPVTASVAVAPGANFISPAGTIIPIAAGPLGRRNFQALTSPDKAGTISRRHLQITYEERRFYIEDLGSTNGTRLNGSEIRGNDRHSIEDGDTVDLAGALKMTFRV